MYLDTDKLAQQLYDASLTAEEVPLADLRATLSWANPGHETIDEPENFRWFLIKAFPTKNFGITLKELMKEAGSMAKDEKWKHDRIIDLIRSGKPEWPAFSTANGIIVDGYHRIAAHGTMKDKTMGVVVAVKRRSDDLWDVSWNEAFPA